MPLCIRYLSRETISGKYLKNVADKCLNLTGMKDFEIDLIFIGKKRMRDLNRIYRKKDKVTDVLSFGNEKDVKIKFIIPKDAEANLGEIFICMERAKEQANLKGHSLKKEVAILLIHGILHLAGFDHEKDEDARIMQKQENKLIADL